ncbi:DUF4194 domain-containing protein [Uniformispora flossi]|uniref:DUF4194 domain-containing protein n=1 Tax=Uniformispora flossi TaxID=3390723 RepID=UPI003C2E39CC
MSDAHFGLAVAQLMKGVVYRDQHEAAWRHLMAGQAQVRDHVAVIGLTVVVDDAEGYAYLTSRPEDPDAQGETVELPRLVPRHRLSLHVSLLLALLRKRLAEHDAQGGDARLVLTGEQIADMMRLFLPETTQEARLMDRIKVHIAKAEDLSFLRRLGGTDAYEVRRILKAFVDAEWLSGFEEALRAYGAEVSGATDGNGPSDASDLGSGGD